jgi:hypothetical protein
MIEIICIVFVLTILVLAKASTMNDNNFHEPKNH